MGRYRRPVTCRYCWKEGHNKRGCPKYKEDVGRGEVSEYSKLAPRRCSYCGLSGHDRRKCENLHQDKVTAILSNRKWIELVLKDLQKNGVGVGSLLKMKKERYYGSNDFFLAMVTGFKWENLFYRRPTKAWIKIKNFYGNKQQSYLYEEGHVSCGDAHCPHFDDASGDLYENSHDYKNQSWQKMKLQGSIDNSEQITIVSTVEQDLSRIAPTEVLNGGIGIKDWFCGKQSSTYQDNVWKTS